MGKVRRRSKRLKGYNYSQAGAYFVTICSYHRKNTFGQISEASMHLNAAGEMVQEIWNEIPQLCARTEIDEFVVMPNYIHGIISLRDEDVGAGPRKQSQKPKMDVFPGRGASRSALISGGSRTAPTDGVAKPSVLRQSPRACPSILHDTSHGQARGPAPTMSLPSVVQRFKSLTTAKYVSNGRLPSHGPPPRRLWQRNYYEHIIRDENSLNRIREYIVTNPLRWALDRENPDRTGADEFDLWLSALEGKPSLNRPYEPHKGNP